MPSIPPESCHHRVEKSLPETSFEVVIRFKTEQQAQDVKGACEQIPYIGQESVEVREVAK